ncbi:hypothetical protein SynPROSU1_00710 [Synechococcus sp. PROS-U-1]|nr:hypothetical protein SynPROSU1_00710 [Synechococcus sp. PROS-U-1]
MTSQTKTLFSWKYAGILAGIKLGVVAMVFGLSRAGLLPGWLPFGG